MAKQIYDDDRREFRRKRRKKNQAAAFLAMLALLAGLAAGGVWGAGKVMVIVQEKKEERLAAKQAAEAAAAQAEAEAQAEKEAAEAAAQAAQEPEEPEEVYSQEDILAQVVDSVLQDMTLEEKAAGIFMVTPEAITDVSTVIQAGDGTKEALEKYPVGGLIYFKQNIKDEEQLKDMLSNTSTFSKYPVFLGVDEEGGEVTRVASALKLEAVPSMGELGESGDSAQAYDIMQKVGAYLSSYGFNMDFAPVADVLTDPDNKTIGERSFGSDAAVVAEMTAEAVKGLQDAGVSACLKHFPGLGSTKEDTHDGAAVSKRTLEEMRAEEFTAFRAGIEAGADFVMVSHASVPEAAGDDTPACLSSQVVTDLLRNELGFGGVIITDSLSMKAVTDSHESAEAAVLALQAGCDMLLMPENFEEAYQGVLNAVNDGTLTEERLDESLRRIFNIKYAGTVEDEEGQGLISDEDAAAAVVTAEDGSGGDAAEDGSGGDAAEGMDGTGGVTIVGSKR